MTPALWIELATFMSAMVAGAFVLVRYINAEDSTVIRDTDQKIGRVYTRIDDMKEKFVQKDMCKILHEQTASNLSSSELRSGVRFDKVEKKIDQILEIVMVLKK